MGLRKRIFQNSVASLIQKVLRAVDQIILVPIFISTWGAEYYGDWITLTIIPTIIGLSDFGFGTAAGNSFVLSYTSNNKKEAFEIAKAGFSLITIVILAVVLITILGIWIFESQIDSSSMSFSKSEIRNTVLMLVFAKILLFYYQLVQAFFYVKRHASQIISIANVFSILNLLSSILVLVLGGTAVELSATILALSILYIPVLLYVALKKVKLLDIIGSDLRLIHFKQIMEKGFGFLMAPLWQACYFQGLTIIIRILIGPIHVTIFNTARILIRLINQGLSLLYNAVFPELQFEIGSGNYRMVRIIFRVLIVSACVIGLLGSILLLLFGLDFYFIWTGNNLELEMRDWVIMVCSVFFNSVWTTAQIIPFALNRPYIVNVAALFGAILSVSAAYILTVNYGLTGISVGYVIIDVVLFVIIVPKAFKLVDQSISTIFCNFLSDFRFLVSLNRNWN